MIFVSDLVCYSNKHVLMRVIVKAMSWFSTTNISGLENEDKILSLNICIFLNKYLNYRGLPLASLLIVFILTYGLFLYFKLQATTGCDDSECTSELFEVTSVGLGESV